MQKLLSLSLALALLCAPALSLAVPVTLSGSGTDILSGVAVPQVPARVTVIGNVSLTLTGGKYEYDFNSDKAASACAPLTEAATYDALVEGDGPWTIAIDPLAQGETVAFEGTGPFVSDFFPLDAPHIITFSCTLPDVKDGFALSNVFLDLNYTNHWASASSNSLANEMLSGGQSYTADLILKPEDGASNYYWSLAVDPTVTWSIVLKK
ncbi:MAG: hypothetical protein VB104_07775 [Candidatus Limiplasma sp.]|nr:hypothetical protein [Candidatus Limiplasma sp.]